MTTTALFIVIFARDSWWIDLNGKSRGPFETREIAEADAIGIAQAYAKNGRRAEVRVLAAGAKEKAKIVWQSEEKSVLARSPTLADH